MVSALAYPADTPRAEVGVGHSTRTNDGSGERASGGGVPSSGARLWASGCTRGAARCDTVVRWRWCSGRLFGVSLLLVANCSGARARRRARSHARQYQGPSVLSARARFSRPADQRANGAAGNRSESAVWISRWRMWKARSSNLLRRSQLVTSSLHLLVLQGPHAGAMLSSV